MAYSRNDIGLHSRRSFSKTMNRALPWDPLLPHFPFTSKPSYSAIQLCLCHQPIPSFHRISMCITANVEQINSNGLYQVVKSDKNPAKIHNFAIIICRLICQKKSQRKNPKPQCLKIIKNVAFELFNFGIFTNLCQCLVTLSDCKVQFFKKSPKLNILSTQIVNVARFARNFECDFLCDFQ